MNKLKDYQVVVIGSGAGGGHLADYLAAKGINVLIIESGKYRKRTDFNQRERYMSGIYYNRGAYFSENLQIALAAANTVGGSTAVYTGVSFRLPEEIRQKWQNDFGLSFLTKEYTDRFFEQLEKDINVHELSENEINEHNQLFRSGAEKLNIEVKKLRINTRNCKGQGFCNLGCTEGAKQGTLEVQIPRAVINGADLIPMAYVNKITENKVFFTLKEEYGYHEQILKPGQYEVSAEKIVLAAGVLNTPAILLRSGNLISQNDNIGRYITLHPAFNLQAIHTKRIENKDGFPKAYYIDEFSEKLGFYIETSFYYPGISAKNIPVWGKKHLEMMRNYDKMMSILILSHDKAEKNNRIKINRKGLPVIDYSLGQELKQSLVNGIKKSAEIFFAAGAQKAWLPASKEAITEKNIAQIDEIINLDFLDLNKTPLSTAHPQGGCRMGISPEISLCDTKGKIWGTQSIYVADASLFPSSVKVNPYETVMLMANRVAESIYKELK